MKNRKIPIFSSSFHWTSAFCVLCALRFRVHPNDFVFFSLLFALDVFVSNCGLSRLIGKLRWRKLWNGCVNMRLLFSFRSFFSPFLFVGSNDFEWLFIRRWVNRHPFDSKTKEKQLPHASSERIRFFLVCVCLLWRKGEAKRVEKCVLFVWIAAWADDTKLSNCSMNIQ